MPSPARPHDSGDDPRTEGPKRPRTKEATTTHPTPPDPASEAPATSEPRHHGGAPHRHLAPEERLARHRRPTDRHRASGTRNPGAARRVGLVVAIAAALLVGLASPAYAAGSGTQTLSGLISNLTTWIVGILAGVATLFLTIGGLRYLTAGGDPGQVEKAKTALKSAAVGYALAVLAPLIVSILASLVGGG